MFDQHQLVSRTFAMYEISKINPCCRGSNSLTGDRNNFFGVVLPGIKNRVSFDHIDPAVWEGDRDQFQF